VERILRAMEDVFEHCARHDFEFLGLSEAVAVA
jgi:hypothetical protein